MSHRRKPLENEGAARGALNTINHNDHRKWKDTNKFNIHSTSKEHDRGDGRTMDTIRESALERAASGYMIPQVDILAAISTIFTRPARYPYSHPYHRW
jgi:hypothetical protein